MDQAQKEIELYDSNNTIRSVRPFGLMDKVGYLLGDFGGSLFFILVNSYLMVYYTDILHISAATVGILFLVANIWNAFADVLWGRFIDSRRNKKHGTFILWIFRMSFPLVIVGMLMFVMIPGMPDGFYVAWAVAMYILWGTLYSTVNIPYGSMASVITNDPVERTSLSTWRTMGSSLAALIISVGGPLILFDNNIASADRFLLTAVMFGFLSLASIIVCVKLSTERIIVPKMEKKKGDFKRTARGLVKNKSLIWMLVVSLIFMATMLMIGVVNVYLFKDYFGTTIALSMFGFIQTATVFIVVPIINQAVTRFGKKEIGSVGLLIAGVTYLFLYLLPDVSVPLFILLTAVGMLGINLFNIITWAFVTDVTDYHEYITGKREDGTVYSIYSFSRKIGQALAGGLAGIAITAVGYDATRGTQSQDVLDGIYSLATLAPGIMFLLGFLALAIFYPLNKKRTNQLADDLAKNRRENK
ncbi:MFS transporter [Oceanobacillus sp. Castelsardo]|uniref:MFS transporter n=1 Tax=Oceanobacillus sp. Castelsardo TaxID=1851204 RepID=UPI000838D86E|nr:glycoside-pentoside-hexuronide (GPH):cation symporter [Oceanobacillus sp. Castelsardo]